MSNFTASMAVVALVGANFFLMIRGGLWVSDLSEGIASGGFQGLPISTAHRRYLLQSRFVLNTGTLITMSLFLAIGWYFVGTNADAEDAKLLAYMASFLNGGIAIGWPLTLPSHYRHLSAVIGEAEAD
jgi:hypothetical protein